MKQTIHYTITFFSYWAVGTGLGSKGSRDSIVLKDDKGLPMIPGKTLKGLLREAAQESGMPKTIEILLYGHRKPKADGDKLAGKDLKAGIVHFGSAYLPKKEREFLASSPKLIRGLYDTRTSTRLATNKQAADHSLRKNEVCIPLTLEAQLSYEEPENNIEDKADNDATETEKVDYNMEFKNAFDMLRHLGEKRYRGFGRCEVKPKEKIL